MPELPEVETIRRDLANKILNQPIITVNILNSKTARQSAAFFEKNLLYHSFEKIDRRGKLLILKIKLGDYLLIHLKMTGQLIYTDRYNKLAGGHSLADSSFKEAVGGPLPNKYTRVLLKFKNGGILFFNDLRKFGYLQIVAAAELEKIIKNNYGPEPLSDDFTLENFQQLLQNRKMKIKALLLNQKLISGLGNIYVDESLWAARLHPERLASKIKSEEVKKLYQAINRIIKRAIDYRGTTFSDYVDSTGHSGNFSDLLKVYGRQKQPCLNCYRPLTKKKIAGRGTHYCTYCQK